MDPNWYPALQSIENYSLAINRTKNWRDLYEREFKLTDEQRDDAGNLWTDYQLADQTLVPFYEGIPEVIRELKSISHGIVSQNSNQIITQQLKENGLIDYFGSVIGYEEVEFAKQKPQPDGLIMCIEELTKLKPGLAIYIGDHESDVHCAFNANQVFKDENIDIEIISVGAFYIDGTDDSNWTMKPNFKAKNTKDILEIMNNFR